MNMNLLTACCIILLLYS